MTPAAVTSLSAEILSVFHALADENRLRIVDALRDGERCVCELQEELGLGQSLLSHHLRALRESGLVWGRREGRWVHYSLSERAVREVATFFRGLREDAATEDPRSGPCRRVT